MTSKEAHAWLLSLFREQIKDLELIDVIGSYYICFKKPDRFFHRFPEWVFVFRSQDLTTFVEFRVFDTRIPPIPMFGSLDVNALLTPTLEPRIAGGEIVSFISLKVTPEYLGLYLPYGEGERPDPALGSYILVVVDQEGRSLIELTGGTSSDFIPEVVESVNDKVFARVRVAGRPTDYSGNRTIIEYPGKLGKIAVIKAEHEGNEFYRSLSPIRNWEIDVDEALANAIERGAKAIPPDKLGMAGGPGTFRLINNAVNNLTGEFWRIPYRVGIRPVLINARNGKVYAMNNRGDYSTRWEKQFVLED